MDSADFLGLPARVAKPRTVGITHVMDKGLGLDAIRSMVEMSGDYIDIVKLGWGTSYVTRNLKQKLDQYRGHGIPVVCGGTFFEVVYGHGKLAQYKPWLQHFGFTHVEISDGTLDIPREEKLEVIADFARDFTVLSEVGSKDSSVEYTADEWITWLNEDLAAGAWKVITEARESGTAGVFRGAYQTAYHALLQRGRQVAGEWVLVHGAAGGIGIAAIQVAKLFGAKVIATASSEEKRKACLEEGADHAIDYRGGFTDQVKELTGGWGVDIVYDPIGDKVADESLRCLAWCGRLLILGFLGGGPTQIRSNYLLIKGIDAIGVRVGGLNEANPALANANMHTLVDLAGQGLLKPRISHSFPLAQAKDALQAVIDRAVIGKAVLVS